MKKKGLIEKMLMRDPANEDFSVSQFPENRGKLFLYMLKNKFSKIYVNHLITALFFLPLIVWGVLTVGYTDWIFSLEAREGITHFVEYWFTVYITAIPMWVIAFVGLSGGLNIIRKLAWSDPVMIKADFLQGIKASGVQMAQVGLLWGVGYALIRYAIDWLGFYYRVFDSSYSVVFGIFVCIFLMLCLVGITVYMACMSSLYKVTFGQLLIGSFKLYFADFFLASGVILLCLAPILILMLTGYAITLLIAYLLLLLLLIGIILIPMLLVCHHTFDRIINKKDYPSYYGRGLSYGEHPGGQTNVGEEDDNYSVDSDSDTENKKLIENDFERVSDDENRC